MSTISASTTTTTAYKVTADTTGTLVLQTGATPTTAVTVGTDQSVTFAQAANLPNTFGFKNRIINGWMSINQRGSSLSTNNTWNYFIDRMWGFSGSGTAATFSQISSTGLAGLPYGARAQRTAANTGTSAIYTGQIVESNNLQDLQGQAVSISFWARAGANFSAATNLLGVYLRTGTTADQGLTALISGWAGAVDQSSTVTLTTSWQKFTVTSFTVGATAQELSVFFGYTPVGTAGANDYVDITGVQLEKGSTATSFDYRPYGTELALCQRYYWRQTASAVFEYYGTGYASSTTNAYIAINNPVVMRVAPAGLDISTASGLQVNQVTPSAVTANATGSKIIAVIATVASGLITNGGAALYSNNNLTSYIGANAEL